MLSLLILMELLLEFWILNSFLAVCRAFRLFFERDFASALKRFYNQDKMLLEKINSCKIKLKGNFHVKYANATIWQPKWEVQLRNAKSDRICHGENDAARKIAKGTLTEVKETSKKRKNLLKTDLVARTPFGFSCAFDKMLFRCAK